jgi:glycolate oxidase FAD binding subunit
MARLRDVLGQAGVEEHEPLALEGAKLEATLRPESGESLAALLRTLAELELPVLVRGGGSRLETANVPCPATLLLDTRALDADPEIDLEEGVARLPAGLALTSLQRDLAGSGLELPLDPPGAAATVGGTLAAAASGPCFGPVRDVVLGLGIAIGSGERVRCGGRVVKNVTGYDLAKLFLGSFGSLGVLEWAWLRLRPTPERVVTCTGVLPPGGEGFPTTLAAARRPTARAAALADGAVLGAGSGRRLVVELAGDAESVEADLVALREGVGAVPSSEPWVERLRAAQGAGPLRMRHAAPPTRLWEAAEVMDAAGASLLAYPVRGLLYSNFPLAQGDEGEADLAWRAACEAAARLGGGLRIEAAPVAAREGRPALEELGASAQLHRAIKRQFDPRGILNPGRFSGGL